ncbi:MAG: Flp pilus assembly complex ATPase component TadA [Ruminococcus sp.]|nr:Flp pilus assembly complex ATPase component TadA [Ruminococcus sp.]
MKNKRFKNAIKCLSADLYHILSNTPEKIADSVQEIILRAERPLCVQSNSKRFYYTKNHCITDAILTDQMVVTSKRSVFDTFQNICNYSVYTRQNEINNGYITIKGGHRAGICGTAVVSDGKIVNIKDITSINIRIAREIIGCSDELHSMLSSENKGVLVCGAPCSGKTTILRDLARKLSYENKVSIIDERNELASTVNGEFQNDIGLCDVFDGYIKSDAITQAVRSMSPDIIVCDEISNYDDVKAVELGVNSGVCFIATMHADNITTLLHRDIAKRLLSTNAFEKIVFLITEKTLEK